MPTGLLRRGRSKVRCTKAAVLRTAMGAAGELVECVEVGP